MRRKQFTLPALVMSLTALNGMAQQSKKPNILVIIADDMARSELGCYGGQNLATPNIDQLANEGMMMTNNFASMAMSVPIRASMYTGLYPTHHGSYQNHKATYGHVKSVTHYLSELGYRVGRAGKDHPVGQPKVYGFEELPGFPVGCTMSHPFRPTPDGITEFMNRNAGQPFCLFVCSINSHMPWDAGEASEFDASKVVLPPNCIDTEKTRTDFCNYLAEIRLFDNEVGMVMKALKDSGADENTMVILLSEQGPQMPFGKWTCYRYGQASAMIVRYPGKIKAGSRSDALVQYEDILPTMIDLAGGQPIAGLDGVSQLDVFLGKDTDKREWVYGMHNNNPEGPVYPIRSIQDKRYKLIENLTPDSAYHEKHMMSNGNNMWQSWLKKAQTDEHAAWLSNKFVHRPAIEFYDHLTDPWELNNLASDPQYAERIALMDKELKRWLAEQGDRGILMDGKNPENPTLKTPVAISSYQDLKDISNDLDGNYYLAHDIVIPEGKEWIPLGASSRTDADPGRFRGILDGRGHSIVGLRIQGTTPFKGLFGRIDHAVIRNIRLKDADISGTAPTGGITGAMIGSSIIENVTVTGSIVSNREAGGIAGRVARDERNTDYNVIRKCTVKASVAVTQPGRKNQENSSAGGLVGGKHADNGNAVAKLEIASCRFTGRKLSGKSSDCTYATEALGFPENDPNVKSSSR